MSESRSEFEAWARENLPGIKLYRDVHKPELYASIALEVRWQGYLLGRRAALESAAKLCEEEAHPRTVVKNEDGALACLCCAEEIRALSKAQEGEA